MCLLYPNIALSDSTYHNVCRENPQCTVLLRAKSANEQSMLKLPVALLVSEPDRLLYVNVELNIGTTRLVNLELLEDMLQ